MPNFPPLDASVQWKISTGAIRFRESGYRATIDEILSSGLATEDGPAPRLIDVAPVDPAGFQSEVVAAMERLVLAGVVHGDLSAFNILIHQDRPWFIDFSDSLRVDRLGQSPWQRLSEAREVLRRDLGGLASYFGRFGVGLAGEAIPGRPVPGVS